MKRPTTLRLLSAAILFVMAAFASAGDRAAELLKSVVDLRRTLTTQAQEKAKADGSRIDFAAIAGQVKAKAEEAVKGVDPAKVEREESIEWAQLFSMAGRTRDTQVVLANYLASKPDGMKLYQAHSMMLSASATNGDSKAMAASLQAIQPYDTASTIGWASIVCAYAPRVVGEVGVEKAISLIDHAMDVVSKADLNAQLKARVASIQNTALQNKIEIYIDSGQRERALKVLDDALTSASPEMKPRLLTLKNQLNLVGSAAPTLSIERGYGDFPGLDALKGKVVILDFFAHWCGPCKAAFPDMRDMYAALKPKGLEMVGVTTYYGYVGDPSVKLTPDEEFAKMKDFVKEQNMTWPVVFGGRENFSLYGVTAIPHVVVLARDGSVRKLEIGYTAEGFAEFRKEIESLLAES